MNIKKTSLKTSDGSHIYYEISGKGYPLFLLHGNGGSSNYFSQQIPEFSQHFIVFNIDSRGHGKSTNNSPFLSFEQMADDLYSIMKKENIEQANFIGFSDGANLAMIFTKKYPNMVKKLVLNAGNTVEQAVYLPFRITSYLAYFFFEFVGIFSKKSKNKAQIIHLMLGNLNISKQDLNCFPCKTLILVGKYDIIKNSHSFYLSKQIPKSSFVLIQKQGHSFAKKAPEIFNKEILTFFNEK